MGDTSRLEKDTTNYKEYFDKLVAFTRNLQKVGEASSFEDFISELEMVLDETTSFIYYKFYQKNPQTGQLEVRSELGPDELSITDEIYQWSLSNGSPSLIPFTTEIDENIKANILIPLSGQSSYGVISLWVDYSSSEFNLYRSLALAMLSQEVCSTLGMMELTGALQEQKSFMECILSSAPNGMLALDLDEKIVNINSNAEILFNVKRNEALNKAVFDVLPEKIHSVIHGLVINSERSGGASETEFEYELSEGNILYLGLSVSSIINFNGEKIGYVIICRDLALSREVAKLRELDAMKNDFVSLVSHELRTPLSSIISYAEVLLTPGMIESKEEGDEFLNIILSEGQRLARLINDILDLSKSESGKMEYIFAPQDINSIISQCMRNSRSLSDNKDIELREELGENLPTVMCDIDRIIQVVLNILSNAIKFTPENGLIIAYSRKIEKDDKEYIQVEIKDNGCGIAKSDVDKVFNKFEQVESVESHSTGTGLGMPICKNFIEQGHGGKMYLESEIGQGTSMFFEIPL